MNAFAGGVKRDEWGVLRMPSAVALSSSSASLETVEGWSEEEEEGATGLVVGRRWRFSFEERRRSDSSSSSSEGEVDVWVWL